jgi:hypothetical protein
MNIPQPVINLIKNKMTQGLTPESIVTQMVGNNPILTNVIKMAKNGDNAGVEKFARKICEQRGISYDDKLAELKSYFK